MPPLRPKTAVGLKPTAVFACGATLEKFCEAEASSHSKRSRGELAHQRRAIGIFAEGENAATSTKKSNRAFALLLFLLVAPLSKSSAKQKRVRIPNAEIDELARQAERSGIFATPESTARMVFILHLL